MSLAHSPSIVTNGLMLCLDAANIKSYPGSGTTWYDVSGNGRSGVMQNSPVYTTLNGVQCFETNRTANQNVIVASYPSTNQRTYELWINHKSFPGWQTWFDDGNSERILFGTPTNGVSIYPDLSFTANLVINTWYHIAYTLSGTAAVGYVNGVSVGSGSYVSATTGTSTLYILGDGGGEVTNGYTSCIKTYNRALSADEITQNFYAMRGRFGI